jgi:hypothetical protein
MEWITRAGEPSNPRNAFSATGGSSEVHAALVRGEIQV